jgi:hypothetical protein
MPEPVGGVNFDDQRGQADQYEVAAQYIQNVQNNTPAGIVEAPRLQNASVAETVGDGKSPHSPEIMAETPPGSLDSINNSVGSKRDNAEIDQKRYDEGNIHLPVSRDSRRDNTEIDQGGCNKSSVDPSMNKDADGDGLVDGLDKKNQTRAQIAAELVRIAAERRMFKKFRDSNPVRSLSTVGNLLSNNDAMNSGLSARSKNRAPGEIDFSGLDSDKDSRVGGILAGEKNF